MDFEFAVNFVTRVKEVANRSNSESYLMYKDFEKTYVLSKNKNSGIIAQLACLEMRLYHTINHYYDMDQGHYYWCMKNFIGKKIHDLDRFQPYFGYATYFLKNVSPNMIHSGQVPVPPRQKKLQTNNRLFSQALKSVS